MPLLSNVMESIAYEQIIHYLSINNLGTNFQNAYREGHSTATALSQMTDDWLREIEGKKIVGAVDHKLLLENLECYGFDRSTVSWYES